MLIRSIAYMDAIWWSRVIYSRLSPSTSHGGSCLSEQFPAYQRTSTANWNSSFCYSVSEDHRDETLSLLIPVQAICSLGIFGTILVPCCGWAMSVWLFSFSVMNTQDRHLPVCCKVERRVMWMESVSRVVMKMDCEGQCHTQGESHQCFFVLCVQNRTHGDS